MSKEKELKNLSRSELIEIIYLLKKNEQELTARVEELQEQLNARNMKISDVGSVAEASLAITDVFARAQEAADIYLEEIKRRRDEAERTSLEIISDAEKKAKQIIDLASSVWQIPNKKRNFTNTKWE